MSKQLSSSTSDSSVMQERSYVKGNLDSKPRLSTCLPEISISFNIDKESTPTTNSSQQQNSRLSLLSEGTQTKNPENYTLCAVTEEYKKLMRLLRDDVPEDSVAGQSEYYIRSLLRDNPLETRHLLQVIGFNSFSFENTGVFLNLLHALSHLKQSEAFPEGQFIALGALLHENDEVKGYGVKCFENWKSIDNIPMLLKTRTAHQWLQDYIADVVADLRSN